MLLCEDVWLPNGFEEHEWVDAETGRPFTLGVHEAWEDLLWLKHMHQLPTRLRRERGISPAAEAARAELLASDCGPSACFHATCFSFTDPVCDTLLNLVCAAKGHSEHVPHGHRGMRALGVASASVMVASLRNGDRDPRLFEPVATDESDTEHENAYTRGVLGPTRTFSFAGSDAWQRPFWVTTNSGSDDEDENEAWERDFMSSDDEADPQPKKRVRRSADAEALREALIDPEIAARALHTSASVRNLRNRSVPAALWSPPPRPNLCNANAERET